MCHFYSKVRVAYQAIIEKRYSHRYYLSAEEQKTFEPYLVDIEEEGDTQLSQCVRSKEDYVAYKFVLLSEKVVGIFKHDRSLHREIASGEASLLAQRLLFISIPLQETGWKVYGLHVS